MAPASLVWFRRDLRLDDHPALTAAVADGGPVIPVFVLDPETEAIGAAARWRLGLSIADLAKRLEALGSRLVLRRGAAREALLGLAREVGAGRVHWSRFLAPEAVARDRDVEAALREAGVAAAEHPGHLLHDPRVVATVAGAPYSVFTPFWNALCRREVAAPLAPPGRLPPPTAWPASERLEDWRLGELMGRGAAVVAAHACVGEMAAAARLDGFLAGPLAAYAHDRDRPDRAGTSRLSENLAYGEISPRRVWHGAWRALQEGASGAETFLRELAWREFAWHLLWHHPTLAGANWRREWNGFPWRGDNEDAERWRRGMTGEPMVDAGMREMYVTGRMHNRLRMLTASYLTKHLMTDWRVGLAWFADCLTDWDPASNALGWQWTAGSGPDAAPFFRVFSPARQAERFDPAGAYRARFVAGFGDRPLHRDAASFFDAAPPAWQLDLAGPYPAPVVDAQAARRRALAAYESFRR